MGLFYTYLGAVDLGLIWGFLALGVYITFRLLDIADLTVDGSFATGGAVCAVLCPKISAETVRQQNFLRAGAGAARRAGSVQSLRRVCLQSRVAL